MIYPTRTVTYLHYFPDAKHDIICACPVLIAVSHLAHGRAASANPGHSQQHYSPSRRRNKDSCTCSTALCRKEMPAVEYIYCLLCVPAGHAGRPAAIRARSVVRTPNEALKARLAPPRVSRYRLVTEACRRLGCGASQTFRE